MHSVGIESKTKAFAAQLTDFQNGGEEQRSAGPAENHDSEASQREHWLIIAPDGSQCLLLS
jgi:hypothetical protein